MFEKSHTHTNNTDATRVKSVDSSMPATSSATQATNEEATRMMTGQSYTGSLTDIQLEIGSVVKNTYELVVVLGEGGMGTVYKARNKDWAEVGARDPYVALKVLKPELSDNRELVMGLFREFDRTKMLAECPNNIKVHDFGRDGPHVYMTMEYLTGQTLSEYLNRQPMSLTQAWFIIEGVGNALAFAHEHNIVHRDIKPGNIFITREGIVKVLDFGIASKINENEDDKTKFNGDDLGAFTLAYASPDTRLGDAPDCRDDIYSFACVIYEILTGKKFFDPKRKSKKAEPIQGLNSKQMEALNKALAFERELRTGNIRELLDKLRPVKTPWVKYLSIGGGVFVISGLVLWGVKELTTSPEVKPASVSQTIQTPAVTPTPAPMPPPVAAPLPQEPVPVAATPTAPAPEITSVNSEPDYSSTSSDGIIHLQTSKPEYKNGEPFQLSYTLTQPMYVRVIDRDVNGVVTTLRPNPRQPDKLQPENKEHLFPPKGFNVPVTGSGGASIVTIVASAQPFSKTMKLLNNDGSISEQVLSGAYSWTQVRYKLHQ